MRKHTSKILQTALISFLGFVFFANTAFAITFSYNSQTGILNAQCSGGGTYLLILEGSPNNGGASEGIDCVTGYVDFPMFDAYGDPLLNDYWLLETNTEICYDPVQLDFSQCLLEEYIGLVEIEEISTNGIQQLVNNGEQVFQSTTGESVGGAVDFVGDNFVKLFIGTAFSFLYRMWYWIIGLVIISSIVYFSYRAFRFFRK